MGGQWGRDWAKRDCWGIGVEVGEREDRGAIVDVWGEGLGDGDC